LSGKRTSALALSIPKVLLLRLYRTIS